MEQIHLICTTSLKSLQEFYNALFTLSNRTTSGRQAHYLIIIAWGDPMTTNHVLYYLGRFNSFQWPNIQTDGLKLANIDLFLPCGIINSRCNEKHQIFCLWFFCQLLWMFSVEIQLTIEFSISHLFSDLFFFFFKYSPWSCNYNDC